MLTTMLSGATSTTTLVAAAVLAATLWIAWFGLSTWLWTPAGLTRTISIESSSAASAATVGDTLVPRVDLDFAGGAHGPRRWFRARWTGHWFVPATGAYEIALGADDWALLRIDGEPILERGGARRYATRMVARALARGVHAIEIEYEQHGGGYFLTAGWAPAGRPARSFDAADVFPAPPTPQQVDTNRRLTWLRYAATVMTPVPLLLPLLVLLVRMFNALRARAAREDGWRGLASRAGHEVIRIAPRLTPIAVLLIVGFAAALRLEAVLTRYGPFDRPAWLHEVQAHGYDALRALRPDRFSFGRIEQPYVGGDPINYIQFGREMTSFYAAHVREPIFPFATKLWLRWVDDQDVAVSFASATFSTLAVLATYFLGSLAFSRWAGLGSALLFAVERDAIAWGADGWRDDAMTFFVVMGCYAVLRVLRTASVPNAIFAGVVFGGAILTRITTVTVLVPALAIIVWYGWRGRNAAYWRAAAIVAAVSAAVVAPYLINCAREFGDPLYAINYHTTFYRARGGMTFDQSMDVGTYVRTLIQRDPTGMLRTMAQGLTSYPFEIKWVGFEYWIAGLGHVLMRLSLIGLVGVALTPTGRVLIALMICSLLPYAFTWAIPGGGEWRFTMHVYPLLTIAAALAVERATILLIDVSRALCARRTRLSEPDVPDEGALPSASA